MRYINIIEYLPEFLRDVTEIKEVMGAENPEFKLFLLECEELINNLSVDCSNNLYLYEKMLEIDSTGLTDEQRRLTIKNILYADTNNLHKYLKSILGEYYKVKLNEYDLDLEVFKNFGFEIEQLQNLISDVVPANLITKIKYTSSISNNTYIGGNFAHSSIIRMKGGI